MDYFMDSEVPLKGVIFIEYSQNLHVDDISKLPAIEPKYP